MDTILFITLAGLWITFVVLVWRRRNAHTLERMKANRAAQEHVRQRLETWV